MNQTTASVPGVSLLPDSTDLFTTGAFVVIAILMALAIAGIIFGARLSRRRRQARAELQEHNAQIERQTSSPPQLTPTMAPEAAEAAPAPVRREAPTPEPRHETPLVTVTPERPRSTPVDIAPAPVPASADGPVTQLKGLGPKVATRLGELGIATVGQMAALTDEQAQALDAQLGPFTGRMGRDRWQEQARFLAAGDKAGFEAVFGRL